MTASIPGHLCPDPGCAARGHQQLNFWPAPVFPTFPSTEPMQPAIPPGPAGMFWTHEQLLALMDTVRAQERQTVLAELELLKQIPATED